MEELRKAIDEIIEEHIIKLVISNKMNKSTEYNKIIFTLKENNSKEYYQIEKYTDKQVFHENIDLDLLEEKVLDYTIDNYKQVSAWASNITFDLRISKKGKIHLGKKTSNNESLINKEHN